MIYPNFSNDKFDVKYTKRKILSSDLNRIESFARTITVTREIENDTDIGSIPGIDEVLNVNQAFTQSRTIDVDLFNLNILNLPNEETSQVLYYDSVTGKLSYGSAPTAIMNAESGVHVDITTEAVRLGGALLENVNIISTGYDLLISTATVNKTALTASNTAAGSAFSISTSQTIAPLGPELNTSPDGWSVTGNFVSSGSGRYTVNPTTVGSSISFDFGTMVVGDIYLVTWTGTLGFINPVFGSYTAVQGINYTFSQISGGRAYLRATNTSGLLTLTNNGSSAGSNYIENISLKKITGTIAPAMYHTSASGQAFELRSDLASNNIALGKDAGRYLASSQYAIRNIVIGNEALPVGVATSDNIAIGYRALNANTDANDNIAIGTEALMTTTKIGRNVAIGFRTLRVATTGEGNVAVGFEALLSTTTGGNNTAIGTSALFRATTAFGNTGVGANTMVNGIVTGSNNTAVGTSSMLALTSGPSNVAVGYQSAVSITTGSNNIAIGNGSGWILQTGSYNVFVGTYTHKGVVNASDENVISGAHVADEALVFIGAEVHKNLAISAATTNAIGIGHQARVYQSNQAVIGNNSITSTFLKGKVEVRDFSVLAANTLADGTFPAGTTKWSVTGGVTLGTNMATFNIASGSGTLSQLVADMAIAPKPGRWYKLTITTSGATAVPGPSLSTYNLSIDGVEVVTIPSEPGFVNGTKRYFLIMKSTPGTFVLNFSGTVGTGNGILNITSVQLTECIGGDVVANRDVKSQIGDVEVETIGKGYILKSPNGTRYRIAVDNSGVLSAAAV